MPPSPSTTAAPGSAAPAGLTPLQLFLRSHITSSQSHPAHSNTVHACTRFLSTASASHTSAAGASSSKRTGIHILYIWPITNTSVSSEWKRWEAHLNQMTELQSSAPSSTEKGGDSDTSTTAPNTNATSTSTPTSTTAPSLHPLPASLPAPFLSTGTRWSVLIEHCFLSRPNSAVTPDPVHSRVARVTFTNTPHQSSSAHHASIAASASQEQWLITNNSIICGNLTTFLDTLGGLNRSTATDTSASNATNTTSSDFLQVKASHSFSGDEYITGDFLIRFGTIRQGGSRVQPCLMLDLEYLNCQVPSHEACHVINEMATRIGVPVDALSFDPFGKLAQFGLSTTTYSLAHTALQYSNLITKMKDIVTQQAAAQQTSAQA